MIPKAKTMNLLQARPGCNTDWAQPCHRVIQLHLESPPER